MEPVRDIHATESVEELMSQYLGSGGFTAKKLGVATDIYKRMLDGDCTKFLSFPACIIATGTRGIIKEMVKEKMADVVITTCGTMDHDLARLWRDYYHGSFQADDAELYKKGINRLGNVFVPNDSYGVILEQKMQEILPKLHKKKSEWSTRDLVWAFGEAIKDEEKAEESIAYWAWKNKVPVFLPGPMDGAWGSQLWMYWQDSHKDFKVNLFEDEQALSEIVFDAKNTGALMVGGGISKHHVIWWNQFRGGLDYAIGMTTAAEWDGSLSGARVREAVSWGKVKEDAKYVTVEGDATILLPLLVSALKK
ncbi:deoxyhypusine synthase [archaeon]